jgi:hypothetical protein
MGEREALLAYCGYYCGDCLGYTGVVADAADALVAVLDRYQFERTAECVFPEELAAYGQFREMLGFMTGLRCPGFCRQGDPECPSGCAVRRCCWEKGYFACYECDEFETCGLLAALHKGLHTESCARNMRAIREMGLEAWIAAGRRHNYWDGG